MIPLYTSNVSISAQCFKLFEWIYWMDDVFCAKNVNNSIQIHTRAFQRVLFFHANNSRLCLVTSSSRLTFYAYPPNWTTKCSTKVPYTNKYTTVYMVVSMIDESYSSLKHNIFITSTGEATAIKITKTINFDRDIAMWSQFTNKFTTRQIPLSQHFYECKNFEQ